ncbi:MAG TPA: Crp/Fnr family transcriptional regulator [Clostridia bacterium]|jgi:CRP-like cAMP-binding protein|nr:MAG: Nitrogen fixation regulation protein FixK [Firmicutes bacterium ADurb.Bin146]HOD92309.1 Crp/Fnr family transcriptional regulator [Clostridia bacterium]HQM38694.1 Crp/Fnr family transcriptional regulator [Clostridia bacterium]
MENLDFNFLSQKVKLFNGISSDCINSMLNCLGAKIVSYKRNEIILMVDDSIESIGLVLEGCVLVSSEDFMGVRAIMAIIEKYDIFAEAFVCANLSKSPVTITAVDNCKIMWLKFPRIIQTCNKACQFHSKLIENMMSLLASKNMQMHQKLDILSKRNLREKILTYLHINASKTKSRTFEIPLSRNELADYLNADRAALSRELSKMKQEGIIDFNLSSFRILQ